MYTVEIRASLKRGETKIHTYGNFDLIRASLNRFQLLWNDARD